LNFMPMALADSDSSAGGFLVSAGAGLLGATGGLGCP